MTSTNISLRKEAYEFLKKLKSQDKSFSDVVLSFKKDKQDIMSFFGVLKDIDWECRKDEMEKLKDNFDRSLT